MLPLRRKVQGMKHSELILLLEEHGWRKKKEGGRHALYEHADYPYLIPIPRHKGKEVPVGTLNKILKQAGIKK